MFNLRFVLPYWFSVLLICPLVQVGCWSPLLLLCYCRFPLLCLLVFAYIVRCSYVGCVNICNCYVFFLIDPLIILYFKVYFFFFEIRIAILVFFCFPFAWNIFFHPFTFSLSVSLGLNRSLLGSICKGLNFVSIPSVCIFWFVHLFHLHLR